MKEKFILSLDNQGDSTYNANGGEITVTVNRKSVLWRIDERLVDRVKEIAQKEERSVNYMAAKLLEYALEQREREKPADNLLGREPGERSVS